MGFMKSLAKYVIFLFNLAIVIIALAFIILGVIFKLELDSEVFKDNDEVKNLALAPILLIVVGCIIFLIAFMGCCGAIKKNSCMLTTYGVILLVILALQLALGIFAIVQIKNNVDLKKAVLDSFKRSLKKYDQSDAITEYIDTTQENLQCCGVMSPGDWNEISKEPPKSCYSSTNTLYSAGCGEKVYEELKANVRTVGIVAIVICCIELVGAILAFWVASGHRSGRYA